MLPHQPELITDQQLRAASVEQIEDLVQRINLMMRERGEPGLVWQTSPGDQSTASDASDPQAPPSAPSSG
jgi:hypothetical protein